MIPFHKMVEFSPDAIYIESDERFEYINPAGMWLLGARCPEEIIGKAVRDFIVPALRSSTAPTSGPLLQVKVLGKKAEEAFIRTNGSQKLVERVAVPYEYDGKPGRMIILHDIGDRIKIQDDLRQSEARYLQLLETSYEGIWTINQQGITEFVNQRGAEILGYTQEEILGKPAFEFLFSPEDVERASSTLSSVAQGMRGTVEARTRHKNGQEVLLLVSTSPILGPDGSFQGALAMFTDITERIRSEQALRESETRLRLALASAPLTLAACDRERRFTWIYNPPGLLPVDDVLGKKDEEVWGYEDIADLIALKEEVLETGQKTQREVRARIHGSWYAYFVTVEPTFDLENKVSGLLCSWVDITNIRRLEAERLEHLTQMEVQRRLMESREKERQEIARDLHDGPIQTLVSTIFNLQFTKEAVRDPALQVELQQIGLSIRSAVRELREVVNELRPPSLIRFGLAKAILVHREDFCERHPELNLQYDLEEEDNQLSEQARLTLFRIYQESLNNVVRHAGARKVSVRFFIKSGKAVLEISDDGQGITGPDNVAILTQEGHYGLAGMKERAESVGGSLFVSSIPGKGTTIRAFVPIKQMENIGNEW